MRQTLKVQKPDFWGLFCIYVSAIMVTHKTIKTIICAMLLVIAAGCVRIADSGLTPEGPDVAAAEAKIILRNPEAESGRLVVYVSAEMAESLENSSSGMAAETFAAVSAISAERVFPAVKQHEERTRRCGLHRWYEISFPDSVSLERAAMSLAVSPSIEKVQFCTPVTKASDGIIRPYTGPAAPQTRAGARFNDPALADQWHYINTGDKSVSPTAASGADINVRDAWNLTAGDPSVIVAVVDGGVCSEHPDLMANLWTNEGEKGNDEDGNGYKGDVHGYNFVKNGPLAWEDHGTHVAGTIAAVNNNGTGVCGIAGGTGQNDGARIMSCQIFDGNESATPAACARAIKYAADNGACILQCSYGYPAGSFTSDREYLDKRYYSVEYDAIRYFMETDNLPDVMDGGLVIFAAGNEGMSMATYPGACGDIVAVTAIASDNLPAYYTNYGPGCNIAAPGGEYYTGGEVNDRAAVLSTLPPGPNGLYGYMQGTSMACPHMSGVAALGLAYAKKLDRHFTHEEMVSMLLTSVDAIDYRLGGTKRTHVGGGQFLQIGDLNLKPYKGKMGTGTVNAWKLLMQIEGTPCHVIRTGEEARINLSSYFGSDAKNLTYLGTEISAQGREALGCGKDVKVTGGRLVFTPTKTGSAKIKITAIAGGDTLGGEEMGGMEISKEISVIARPFVSTTDGWF